MEADRQGTSNIRQLSLSDQILLIDESILKIPYFFINTSFFFESVLIPFFKN